MSYKACDIFKCNAGKTWKYKHCDELHFEEQRYASSYQCNQYDKGHFGYNGYIELNVCKKQKNGHA